LQYYALECLCAFLNEVGAQNPSDDPAPARSTLWTQNEVLTDQSLTSLLFCMNNNHCRRTAARHSSKKRPTQTGTYAHANAHLESCLSRPYFLSLCTFIHVIRRLDAIIRLAAAARSVAISERCIKYLALLASKVLILAAAATCLHRPLALAAGPVTSTFQFTYNPSRFPCLHNRSVSHIMSRCADCAIGGLSPQVDKGFASINKQNPVEVFPPNWPNWPIYTSFLRLIPHMQHAADPSPTCRACRHLACGTV